MRLSNAVALIAVLMVVLSGCSGYGQYMVSTATYSPTNPGDIRLYTVSKPDGKYETLGYLSVYKSDAHDAGDELKKNLREKAAFIGADAITAFKFNLDSQGGGGAEGIAIKFTK